MSYLYNIAIAVASTWIFQYIGFSSTLLTAGRFVPYDRAINAFCIFLSFSQNDRLFSKLFMMPCTYLCTLCRCCGKGMPPFCCQFCHFCGDFPEYYQQNKHKIRQTNKGGRKTESSYNSSTSSPRSNTNRTTNGKDKMAEARKQMLAAPDLNNTQGGHGGTELSTSVTPAPSTIGNKYNNNNNNNRRSCKSRQLTADVPRHVVRATSTTATATTSVEELGDKSPESPDTPIGGNITTSTPGDHDHEGGIELTTAGLNLNIAINMSDNEKGKEKEKDKQQWLGAASNDSNLASPSLSVDTAIRYINGNLNEKNSKFEIPSQPVSPEGSAEPSANGNDDNDDNDGDDDDRLPNTKARLQFEKVQSDTFVLGLPNDKPDFGSNITVSDDENSDILREQMTLGASVSADDDDDDDEDQEEAQNKATPL